MRMCTYTTINHKQLLWCCLWASKRVNSGRLTFDLIKSHEIHHFSTIKPSSVMLFLQASHLPPKLQLSRSAKKQSGSSFLGLWRSHLWVSQTVVMIFDDFWYILIYIWYILMIFGWFWWFWMIFGWFWMIFGWFWWFGIVCNVWLRVYPYWLPIFSRQLCPTTRQKTWQTVGCPGNKMWESSGEHIEMHWIYPLCCAVDRWDCCDVERAWEIQSSFLIGIARHVVVMRIEPKDGYLLAKQRFGKPTECLVQSACSCHNRSSATVAINVFRGDSLQLETIARYSFELLDNKLPELEIFLSNSNDPTLWCQDHQPPPLAEILLHP